MIGDKEIRFKGTPKERSDFLRAKAITGLSLDEITNVKLIIKEEWVGKTTHRTESGQLELPEDMLNPKFVVLIEGMDSAEQFEQFTNDPNNNDKLNQIYDALPDQFKVGYEKFIELQFKLLKRLR